MKTYLFSFILMLLPIAANADAVGIDGIYYNLDSSTKTAEVTRNPNSYSGHVEIPAEVTYGGVKYTVTAIGDGAFEGNLYFHSLGIPTTLKKIGHNAFESTTFGTCNIYNLEQWFHIDFGDSKPQGYLLLNGEEIKDLVIPESITEIPDFVFDGIVNIETVTIHDGVTRIGECAFQACKSLTSVTIGKNLQEIGDGAFLHCYALTSINIPSSLTSIGVGAFEGCRFTSMTLPNGMTEICASTFNDCSYLASLVLGDSMTKIDLQAFGNCKDLTDIYCHTKNVPELELYVYQDIFNRDPLSGWYFYPEYVTVHVPADCVELYKNDPKWSTFKDIVALSDSDQPSQGLPSYNHDLVKINGIWYWLLGSAKEAWAMRDPNYGTTHSGDIVIPEEVTEGNMTFKVTHIESSVFFCSSGMTSVTIPNSVTFIGNGAFYECSNLKSITIPANVTAIGSTAFYGCSGLTSLTIPKGVTKIGTGVIGSCSGLTSITVEEGNTVYDSRNNCNAIIETANNILIAGCNNTTIPDDVMRIEGLAFKGMTGLKSISIPDYVSSVSGSTFERCTSLNYVVIGKGVTFVGSTAFGECTGLKNVYCFAKNAPNTYSDTFDGVNLGNVTLHVPEGSVEAYKAADMWKNFGKIVVFVGIDPITESSETSFGGDNAPINEQTDLTDAVIENTYYTMDADNGDGYDAEEQALVLNSTTTDEQMSTVTEGKVGEESVRDNYAGIILEVSGSGIVSVDAKTIGTHVLNMQIGKEDPTKIAQSERGEVEIAYNVDNPTYIYIYASSNNAASRIVNTRGATENSVLLYGYKIVVDPVRKGDANGDGKVDEKDIELVEDFIMDRPLLNGISLEGAKANGDNVINAADIVTIINIIKKKNK